NPSTPTGALGGAATPAACSTASTIVGMMPRPVAIYARFAMSRKSTACPCCCSAVRALHTASMRSTVSASSSSLSGRQEPNCDWNARSTSTASGIGLSIEGLRHSGSDALQNGGLAPVYQGFRLGKRQRGVEDVLGVVALDLHSVILHAPRL